MLCSHLYDFEASLGYEHVCCLMCVCVFRYAPPAAKRLVFFRLYFPLSLLMKMHIFLFEPLLMHVVLFLFVNV